LNVQIIKDGYYEDLGYEILLELLLFWDIGNMFFILSLRYHSCSRLVAVAKLSFLEKPGKIFFFRETRKEKWQEDKQETENCNWADPLGESGFSAGRLTRANGVCMFFEKIRTTRTPPPPL
jgi:hypothetical protein